MKKTMMYAAAVLTAVAVMLGVLAPAANAKPTGATITQFKTVSKSTGIYTTVLGNTRIKIGYQKQWVLGRSTPAIYRTKWVRADISPNGAGKVVKNAYLETCDVRLKLGKLRDERRRYVDVPWCRGRLDVIYGTVDGPLWFDAPVWVMLAKH
jgi:hypothetical protein